MLMVFIFSMPAVYFANAHTLTSDLTGFLSPYRRTVESPTMNGYEMEDMSMKRTSNNLVENGGNKGRQKKKDKALYDLGI